MKEIISLHVGQAGIKVGTDVWQLFCLQHAIDAQGTLSQNDQGQQFRAYFHQNDKQRFRPRAIFIDLDQSALDQVRIGPKQQFFSQQNIIRGKGDGGGNFARGHSIGKEGANLCLQSLRKQVEKCQNLDGFLVFNSVGGGTGSGLGSLLLERLSQQFAGKSKIDFNIFPDRHKGHNCVQPYNTILSAHSILQTQTTSIVLDNGAIRRRCQQILDIDCPTYKDYNKIFAHVVSGITAPTRIKGPLNFTIPQFQQSLIPFHRFRFLVSNFSPFISSQRSCMLQDYRSITFANFEDYHLMVECQISSGKYLSSRLHYRGILDNKDINTIINALDKQKQQRKIRFADWCPATFQISANFDFPKVFKNDPIRKEMRYCTMICNNTDIGNFLSYHNYQFNRMYKQKAFVHWYVREGTEEAELLDAYNDIETLSQDYYEAQQPTDDIEEGNLLQNIGK